MGISVEDLREGIIVPTLQEMKLCSPAAVELLVGTVAHESLGGHYLRQRTQQGIGPAVGIYQMEPATMKDLWENFVRFRGHLREQIPVSHSPVAWPDPSRLVWDLKYATIWARWNYFRAPDPLPDVNDIRGLADYWLRYWCKGCKGSVSQWMADYYRYVVSV